MKNGAAQPDSKLECPQFQSIAYFDSIAFWTESQDVDAIVYRLKDCCGHGYFKRGPMKYRSSFKYHFCLHQPNHDAFNVIEHLASSTAVLINMAHIALDLVTDTWREAAQLEDVIRPLMIQRWNTHRQGTIWNNTDYDGERLWGRKITATYADRNSKPLAKPCMHIEFRASGAGCVRDFGIKSASDLITFDFREFVSRRLVLKSVRRRNLGRVLARRLDLPTQKRENQSKFGEMIKFDAIMRRAHIFLRHCCDSDEMAQPFARDILRIGRQELGLNLSNCFQSLPNEAFLPPAYGYIYEP